VELFKFVTFLFVSHVGAMQIFNFTTYHAYFWKALPLLVLYSCLAAWVFFEFIMHNYFLWQIVLASIWLFYVGRQQSKQVEALMYLAGDDAESVSDVASSTKKTYRYYAYSSFIYIFVYAVYFLWLLKT